MSAGLLMGLCWCWLVVINLFFLSVFERLDPILPRTDKTARPKR